MSMFKILWGVCLCSTMVYKLTKLYMVDICHLYAQEYIFFAYKNVNTWHLPLISFSLCILKRNTIISSAPTCYTKGRNVNKKSLNKKLFMLAIESYLQLLDVTLSDLHTSSLDPLETLWVTLNKYHKWCSILCNKWCLSFEGAN